MAFCGGWHWLYSQYIVGAVYAVTFGRVESANWSIDEIIIMLSTRLGSLRNKRGRAKRQSANWMRAPADIQPFVASIHPLASWVGRRSERGAGMCSRRFFFFLDWSTGPRFWTRGKTVKCCVPGMIHQVSNIVIRNVEARYQLPATRYMVHRGEAIFQIFFWGCSLLIALIALTALIVLIVLIQVVLLIATSY